MLFQRIGGFGKFQLFCWFAISFGISGPSWFIYEVGYLIQEPDAYICTYTAPVPAGSEICTKYNICADDPRIATWQADPSSDKFLDNWKQRLELTCVDDWKIGMIGASLFLGWTLTLLILPSYADRRGRRKYFWIG